MLLLSYASHLCDAPASRRRIVSSSVCYFLRHVVYPQTRFSPPVEEKRQLFRVRSADAKSLVESRTGGDVDEKYRKTYGRMVISNNVFGHRFSVGLPPRQPRWCASESNPLILSRFTFSTPLTVRGSCKATKTQLSLDSQPVSTVFRDVLPSAVDGIEENRRGTNDN